MPYYRVRLEFLSPVGTPLISGTLWGHLAWAMRYLDGEDALMNWMKEQSERPWLVSCAMPAGFLPRPLLKPMARSREVADLPALEAAKKTKKIAYIREEDFLALSGEMSEKKVQEQLSAYESEAGPPKVKPFRQARNKIDRRTSRTPESGGLFFLDDVAYSPKEGKVQFFVFTETDKLDLLKRLLTYIGVNGFGRKSSIGRGVFRFEIEAENKLFPGKGKRAMSLSHGVLTENMGSCRYRIHPHFGKLGGHLAVGKFSPFKYPILMMAPGATFAPQGTGAFGRMIEAVHHDPLLSGIRHHAFHLPIYFTEATS